MVEYSPEQHDRFLRHFTANQAAIRAFVRSLVPTREDAADVMQEVALVLWRKFEASGIADGGFRPWAFGVARMEALAWLRDRARDRHVLATDVVEALAAESQRDALFFDAQRMALESCLEKLPREQRAAVASAYAPDAKIQEVAQQVGRSVAATYQWLHRIRLKLLECTRRALAAEPA